MMNKEAHKMMREMARKASYVGAGMGLVLFAVFGLMPGSIAGGAMGLNIVGAIFGLPVSSGILQRLIVGASMLMGITVSGIIFVTSFTLAGWLLGAPVGVLWAHRKTEKIA
jgi:hypothetical protein